MARTFTITSYGKTKEYPESQRKKMIKEFETAMLCCDGSEAERYRNIYGDLVAGEKECMDTERPLSLELEAMIERMLTKIQRLRPDDTPYSSGCCHLMKCEYFAGQSSPWDAFLEMERG